MIHDFTILSERLANKHIDLGQCYVAEHDIRMRVLDSRADWKSVAEYERAVDADALHVGVRQDISRLRGEIDSLTVQWETMKTLIQAGAHVSG